ncbi:carboxylesterase family protein [uncultured Parabacteroides sp.]|uniref:alpha/beta hydrolase family protein n=1 Tax=uncultured Parabacteroides sp. TaxID=512312 RepID=UPI002608B74D|nr:carboxylesterase family protein [uncultured Parabacteroides sp.]
MNRNWVYSLFTLWIVCSFACTRPRPVADVEVRKENFVFSIKGTDTLSLDKYELSSMSDSSEKPVMIFAFGGGFKGGDKSDKEYIPYFEFLARNGFVVVSTDYRTALKNLDTSEISSPEDFVAALQYAIDTAVEDFYDATGFVINQSQDWNIDVKRIVASGSSAGAITVLQAEYDLCNGHELAKRLPAGFNYAGVISYAGAVSDRVPPRWGKMPCPIMLFHGDADKTVPFEQAAMENLGGLWGSSSIARSLENLQASYYFYKVENAGHEISGLPLSRNQYDIMSFLTRQVLGGENLAITTSERVPGDTAVRKDFTVQDYILDNLR